MKAADSPFNSFSDIDICFIYTGSLNAVTELTENIHHFMSCITVSVRQTTTYFETAGETS
jgi:hypothetical protein